MRKAMPMMAVLGFIGLALGADPRVGTWKLNLVKSRLPTDVAAIVNESIIVFREVDPDTLEMTHTEISKSGAKIVSLQSTVPRCGGIQTFQRSYFARNTSIVTTMIDSHTGFETLLLNGKQTRVIRWKISEDCKAYSLTTKEDEHLGKAFEALYFYEKQ